MLQSTLNSYEERLGELLSENNLLRQSLHALEEELKSVIAAKNKQAKLLWKKRHATSAEGVQQDNEAEEDEDEQSLQNNRYKNKMVTIGQFISFSNNSETATSCANYMNLSPI